MLLIKNTCKKVKRTNSEVQGWDNYSQDQTPLLKIDTEAPSLKTIVENFIMIALNLGDWCAV